MGIGVGGKALPVNHAKFAIDSTIMRPVETRGSPTTGFDESVKHSTFCQGLSAPAPEANVAGFATTITSQERIAAGIDDRLPLNPKGAALEDRTPTIDCLDSRVAPREASLNVDSERTKFPFLNSPGVSYNACIREWCRRRAVC